MRKVPYLEAFAQVMKDKAIKGEPKAGQMLLLLAKQLGLLDARDNIAGQTFTFQLSPDSEKLEEQWLKNSTSLIDDEGED